MKIKVLLLFAVLCSSAISCVKTTPEPDVTDGGEVSAQIRKISIEAENVGGEYIFRYDSKGRLAQTEFTGYDEAPAYTLSYLYATDYVKVSSDKGHTYMYELDGSGLLARININGSSDYHFDVDFDDSGNVESVVPSEDRMLDNGADLWNAVISDGNCIAFDYFSLQYSEYSNDYSIDLNRVLYDAFDDFRFFKELNFLKFQGISSKNLISGIAVTGRLDTSVSYSFDDSGRITKIYLSESNNSVLMTMQIDY